MQLATSYSSGKRLVFKSPFEKGGFRGIFKRLENPPYPPLEKGGNKLTDYWLLTTGY